jgi:mannose-6-phosphate isomerase
LIRRISNSARDYAWGSLNLISDYFGIEPTNKPMAEIWFGTHAGSPTKVDGAGHSLLAERQGKHLSFLLKILAAAEPLSIQAHPTIAQAKIGFERENAIGIAIDSPTRNYKDAHHKPEMIVALTHFEALTGFRAQTETLELFDLISTGASSEFAQQLQSWRNLLSQSIENLFSHLLDSRGQLEAATEKFSAAADAVLATGYPGEFKPVLELVLRLQELYPGDPGVVIATLMNYLELKPNQGAQLAAGNIHAYLSGLGIEIMAESDNVLRGGLTPKHIDVDELKQIVNFESEEPPLVEAKELSRGLWQYPRAVDDYSLYRIEVTGQNLLADLNLPDDSIILCTGGEVLVTDSQDSIETLKSGQAAYLSGARLFSVSGNGTAFLATH